MSILFNHNNGLVICHSSFLNKIYEKTVKEDSKKKFSIKNDLFEINHPFKSENHEIIACNESLQPKLPKKRKLKKGSPTLDSLTQKIKFLYAEILESAKTNGLFQFNDQTLTDVTNDLCKKAASSCIISTTKLKELGNFNGGNTAPYPLFQKLSYCDILLPPNCSFIGGDVRTTISQLDGKSFDLVVLDPPWWNKYIRRSKAKRPDFSYEMMYNEEIANLPLKKLLSDGALVAVWCTNCLAHNTAIKEQMFTAWGVTYVTTWFWMKVTKSGLPVCPFTEATGKQPFERIVLGVYNKQPSQKDLPEETGILSIPSALHSNKPPLNDVLTPYLSTENPKCLEIFARYLLPNTTSVGLEPLRWQHTCLYTEEDIT